MYDLLIKNGQVVDPDSGINAINDIAITNGLISRVAPDIPVTEATQVIDVKGKIVTPGLIDLHTHVYSGVNGNGVQADIGGVHAGVTTMVDAGSSGCDTYGGFPQHIIQITTPKSYPFCTFVVQGLQPLQTSLARQVSIWIKLFKP